MWLPVFFLRPNGVRVDECLHEVFNCYAPGVPGGFTCEDCGVVWGTFDDRWDTWQERIDAARNPQPPTLF